MKLHLTQMPMISQTNKVDSRLFFVVVLSKIEFRLGGQEVRALIYAKLSSLENPRCDKL